MNKKIWKHVEGSIPPVKSDEWLGKDEQALSLIGLHLGTNIIHHIDAQLTAKDAWETLHLVFGAKAKNQEINLKIEFYGLEMNFDDSFAQFVSKLKSIMTQLEGVDAKVDEKDAIAILLKSMPKEYNALVTTLKNLPDPSLEGCIASILEKEKELKANGSTSKSVFGEQALFTKTDISCYHCGRRGHMKSNCRLKHLSKCSICKKLGHEEDVCRFKQQRQQSNFMEEQSNDEQHKSLFTNVKLMPEESLF